MQRVKNANHSEPADGTSNETILLVADSLLGTKFWEKFVSINRKRANRNYSFASFSAERSRVYKALISNIETIDFSPCIQNYGATHRPTADLEAAAMRFESEYGINIMDLVQADRHLGRGCYYSGGRHMKSLLASKANYWDSVSLIMELSEQLQQVFSERVVKAVVLGGVASLPTKLICVVARKNNVPIRRLSTGRLGSLYYWADDEFMRHSRISRDYIEAQPESNSDVDKLGGYRSVQRARSSFMPLFTGRGVLSRLFRVAYSESRRAVGFFLFKERHKAIDSYFLHQKLLFPLNVYFEHRKLSRLVAKEASALPDKYVFLPLHVEPEAALVILSPEFNSQVALIDFISKSLPAGVFLVIKENPIAVGRRPRGFYEWLASIPNVHLVGLGVSGFELAQGSAVTVTITSTAGFEASALGTPVVTFGQNNLYNALDHVRLITDLREIRPTIREFLRFTPEQRRKASIQGGKLVSAIRSICVDIGDHGLRDEEAVIKLEEAFDQSLRSNVESNRLEQM